MRLRLNHWYHFFHLSFLRSDYLFTDKQGKQVFYHYYVCRKCKQQLCLGETRVTPNLADDRH